ncbi:MAG: toxin-antitoxin system HicB family antitoxin [Spirochaetia bacterium]|jgi:plasmid stability protein
MKQVILRNVPDELHRQVKVAAAAAGMSMQDFIIKLMEKEVAKGKPGR